MNSPYKNIIFDLDGTISDSRQGIYNGLKYSLHEMKVPIADDYDLTGFIGPPIYDCFKEHFFKSDEDITVAIAHFRKYYAETGWSENELYDGMYDLLSQLYKSGFKLFIATNKPQVFTDLIVQHFRIKDFFTMILGVDIDNHHHTKAELINEILESDEGLDASNTFMIGDSKWDIFAADYHHIKTIGVSWGFGGTKKELESYGAFIVAENIDELKNILT